MMLTQIKKSIKDTKVDAKLVSNIVQSTSISSSLNDRSSEGSSGFGEQKRMISNRIKKINAYRTGTTRRDNEVTNSFGNLSKKVKELMK